MKVQPDKGPWRCLSGDRGINARFLQNSISGRANIKTYGYRLGIMFLQNSSATYSMHSRIIYNHVPRRFTILHNHPKSCSASLTALFFLAMIFLILFDAVEAETTAIISNQFAAKYLLMPFFKK